MKKLPYVNSKNILHYPCFMVDIVFLKMKTIYVALLCKQEQQQQHGQTRRLCWFFDPLNCMYMASSCNCEGLMCVQFNVCSNLEWLLMVFYLVLGTPLTKNATEKFFYEKKNSMGEFCAFRLVKCIFVLLLCLRLVGKKIKIHFCASLMFKTGGKKN